MRILIPLLFISIFSQNIKGQDFTIVLEPPFYRDNISAHVESFRDTRRFSDATQHLFKLNKIIEPENSDGFYYFTVYVPGEDSQIDIMVKPEIHGDSLYIDLNNDNNLTNDGGPFYFPALEDEFIFELTFNDNPERKSVRSLLRYPAFALAYRNIFEQFAAENYDSQGNLNQERTQYWQRYDSHFTGKRGSFYYTDRLILRRGYLQIGADSILIGIEDYNVNGLFSDTIDRLYIDYDGNGMLSYRNRSEIFKLDDVVDIFGISLQIHEIDSLGKWITFSKTNSNQNSRFIVPESTQQIVDFHEIYVSDLNANIWGKSFQTISGDSLHFKNYKNKKTLINFWGEWCKPCYKEMPVLVDLNLNHSSNLQIISFLYTQNLDKAKEVMEENDLTWPHILVDDAITEWFQLSGYPSNFLINYPNLEVITSAGIDSNYVRHFILK